MYLYFIDVALGYLFLTSRINKQTQKALLIQFYINVPNIPRNVTCDMATNIWCPGFCGMAAGATVNPVRQIGKNGPNSSQTLINVEL